MCVGGGSPPLITRRNADIFLNRKLCLLPLGGDIQVMQCHSSLPWPSMVGPEKDAGQR